MILPSNALATCRAAIIIATAGMTLHTKSPQLYNYNCQLYVALHWFNL